MVNYYKLDEYKNVVTSSIEEWENFIVGEFPCNYMSIGKYSNGDWRISTIFIGICYKFTESGIPMPFETVCFKKEKPISCKKYITFDEAKKGHDFTVISYQKEFIEDKGEK